ncbi:unnamed protein product [Phytomonas sp. Hart1]|nr:unnamed protein product [Phytomonas sp. Hart1]|eukprot:CCW70996.1 unnamed protein product [Phytomonas sp. isolate Hart1]
MKSGAAILNAVRDKMQSIPVHAFLVPSSDSHNSEYVASHLQRRAFLTNFKGSAGIAVITQEKALLWTDGRYWIDAAEFLYPEFQLMKQGHPDVLSIEDWIVKEIGTSAVVGIDPYSCTIAEWERLSKKITLKAMEDVVSPMMSSEHAPEPLYRRPVEYSGATVAERRAMIVAELEKQRCDLTVLSSLDEVAWLTNLRGRDVPYNPVFYAYAIVDKATPKIRVYVDLAKVTPTVRDECASEVEFFPYDTLVPTLQELPEGQVVLLDERQTSQAVYHVLTERNLSVKRVGCGCVQSLKAIKNDRELGGFRACHVRDGAALTQYLAWVYEQVAVKGVTSLNEYEAAKRLEEYRASDAWFLQPSFGTISAAGANAAICHYAPSPTRCAILRRDQLYLVDSGAQYWDGTTDVTRTISFDKPRDEEREAYTRVLKGHIALNEVIFPKGTGGHRLDALARLALWQVGLDYPHGTGHGVGSFLCVHEGPHGIGSRPMPTGATIDLHCIVSNEPGYYKEGSFGIRIENLEEIVLQPTKYSEDGFLTLSYLTMVPLCRELIDVNLLTQRELDWVNVYHATVVDKLEPKLRERGDERAIAYLKHHTQPI